MTAGFSGLNGLGPYPLGALPGPGQWEGQAQDLVLSPEGALGTRPLLV